MPKKKRAIQNTSEPKPKVLPIKQWHVVHTRAEGLADALNQITSDSIYKIHSIHFIGSTTFTIVCET